MFGYVRPEKPDLLIRDFTAYKAVYCGLCKTIGRRCGQLPRLAVTFDMTFLSVLLLALRPWLPEAVQEGCVLNPLKKKPVLAADPVLDFAADLSCLLAWYSAKDDAADEKPLRGRLTALFLARPAGKAREKHPELDALIQGELDRLAQLERQDSLEETSSCFGALLKAVFLAGLRAAFGEEADEVTALLVGDAAEALGRWIYLIDAFDDLEQDRLKGNPNHLAGLDDPDARKLAESLLIEAEEAVDRNLALLTYEQFGGLVYNIVTAGLPATRQRVLSGQRLPAI